MGRTEQAAQISCARNEGKIVAGGDATNLIPAECRFRHPETSGAEDGMVSKVEAGSE